jgi:hypothetical protein
MTALVTLQCDRCGATWDPISDAVGTSAVQIIQPGQAPETARVLHLCVGCTASHEGFLISGLQVAKLIPPKG